MRYSYLLFFFNYWLNSGYLTVHFSEADIQLTNEQHFLQCAFAQRLKLPYKDVYSALYGKVSQSQLSNPALVLSLS